MLATPLTLPVQETRGDFSAVTKADLDAAERKFTCAEASLTAYYLLHATDHPILTTYYLLMSDDYLLLTTRHLLLTACCLPLPAT